MQIDIVDVIRRQPRLLECHLHGSNRTVALGMGRRDMVGIGRLADTGQQHLAASSLQSKQRRAFTYIDAVAVGAEWIAVPLGDRLKRIEAV